MVEIAQPADGSEHHLKDKPIQGQGQNLDRDDEIYLNTEKKDGKWRYYSQTTGKLIAETDAPAEVNADILSQWGNAVRARTTRERNNEKTEETKNMTESGIALPEGVTVEEPAPQPEPATLDDNPDAYIAGKIQEAERKAKAARIKVLSLEEEIQEVQQAEAAARNEVQKWKRMEAAINAED